LAGRTRRALNSAHQFRKKLAVQIRQHHAQGLRAPAAQAARGCVRTVTQPFDHLQHLMAHRPSNVVVPIERTRNHCDGDVRFPSTIFDGDRTLGHSRRPPRPSS